MHFPYQSFFYNCDNVFSYLKWTIVVILHRILFQTPHTTIPHNISEETMPDDYFIKNTIPYYYTPLKKKPHINAGRPVLINPLRALPQPTYRVYIQRIIYLMSHIFTTKPNNVAFCFQQYFYFLTFYTKSYHYVIN